MFPVITKVPETIRVLKGRHKIAALSRFARQSAKSSSLISNLPVEMFEKDDRGVPVSSNGVWWSVSHKQDFVAGVVSKKKIGIDLEQIKDIPEALFRKIIAPDENLYFKNQDKSIVFFRVFTAKEAVLKLTGHGLSGLSRVRIIKVVDDKTLIVCCSDKKYLVESFCFDGYIASVTKDCFAIQWDIQGEKNGQGKRFYNERCSSRRQRHAKN